MPGPPDFLSLPDRDTKPRSRGLTHVLDKGLDLPRTAALIVQCAPLIDIVKVGWGIAYVDPCIGERVAAYRAAGVDVSLGGTLVEVCAMQGRIPQLRDWALALGVSVMEVSNGLHRLDPDAKTALVRQLAADFAVAAEVGDKDPAAPVVASRWIEEMEADLAAGATWVVAEGRESGNVGIYAEDGSVRSDLIEVVANRIPLDRVIFESPHKSQQAWFIARAGAGVNLGNIAPDDVLPLETLRLGLRADTALLMTPSETAPGERMAP